MKSVPFSEREKERAEQSGTVDVFGPYSGGGCRGVGGRQEKALEFIVVSEKSEKEKVYWKNEGTTCFNFHYV